MITTEKVRGFIVNNFLYGENKGLTDDTSLTEAGIVDSTGILEMISFLEKEFSITIQDEELIPDNLDSVERISQFIRRKGSA